VDAFAVGVEEVAELGLGFVAEVAGWVAGSLWGRSASVVRGEGYLLLWVRRRGSHPVSQ